MRFRVASFNVENLILPDVRYYDRGLDTREVYDAKVNWIASILNRAKPDIVGVQEVWFEEALADAAKRTFHFAGGVNVAAPGATRADNLNGTVAKRPRVGLLSRFPIKAVSSVMAFPASIDLTIPLRVDGGVIKQLPVGVPQFQRPVLRAVLDVNGLELIVYVTHLKSKGPLIREGEDGDDPFVVALGQARAAMVRAAEAAALRHLILADLNATRKPVIVLGDLNDTPDAASTQIVRGLMPKPNMDGEEKRARWDVLLYSTYRIALERSPTIHTHIYDGERDILDHILVSEEFYSRNRSRIGDVVRHDVINDHLRDGPDDRPPPGASDHGVPVAEIALVPLAPYTNG
ncbi:MAG: endonuclease/exonuclease/phosphatase family protein [Micropepsaceae bacterium]